MTVNTWELLGEMNAVNIAHNLGKLPARSDNSGNYNTCPKQTFTCPGQADSY